MTCIVHISGMACQIFIFDKWEVTYKIYLANLNFALINSYLLWFWKFGESNFIFVQNLREQSFVFFFK